MFNCLLKSLPMAQMISSSVSRNLSQRIYSNLDFTRLKNILPSPLKPTLINSSTDLVREDETDDARFYCFPRFVHHIDDRARYVLSQFYRHTIQQTAETKTLDLCSSCTSHLPNDFIGSVHGLGMNQSELQHNPSLNNGYTVQDLNQNPSLTQFSSNSFDTVICSVSIDYLIHPVEIFNEIGRILKPKGQLITAFSNRCFPTKVIGRWLTMNDQERVQWVANYFLVTNSFFDSQTVVAYSIFDDQFLPSRENDFIDPMYIVKGQKKVL